MGYEAYTILMRMMFKGGQTDSYCNQPGWLCWPRGGHPIDLPVIMAHFPKLAGSLGGLLNLVFKNLRILAVPIVEKAPPTNANGES